MRTVDAVMITCLQCFHRVPSRKKECISSFQVLSSHQRFQPLDNIFFQLQGCYPVSAGLAYQCFALTAAEASGKGL